MTQITAKLLKDHIITDMISKKRNGNFLFRKGYYYSHGMTASSYADKISEQLKKEGFTHGVIDFGDHWAAFKGGAPLQSQSHFWVEINVTGHFQNQT